jgi:hemoglobin-like flavoprotein
MTAVTAAAFEASLAAAAARGGDLTADVYDRLFARHPAMRAEFWRDGKGSIRGEMLARVFETLIDMAGPRAFAAPVIATELTTHDAYGIPRPLFAQFFAIVRDSVAEGAGPDWTPAMAAAWDAVLGDIDAMLAVARESDPAS